MSFNRLVVKLTTDARAVRPYFVQPAMRVGMWGGRSFYRPCAALRLLKTCLQIGLTLYEGSCARLAQTFTASPPHRLTKSPPISRLLGLRPHEVAHARHNQCKHCFCSRLLATFTDSSICQQIFLQN